ncbi:POTRA domain-containing protein [Aureibaculum sp. 2210JD6-5]|uniref:POTRA domain-containing protein n=1 Tax=Aureibaculum sp. 2210JD6-5 TaxID=3103957 RepID=UPI002AACD37C|nr:POTRA domain-containing protein [Aureibaculum sp. 2210JD6-5]MDY7395121.1 POTRA domain-containing protein [Aureibaculum sp. 2210JD6-5]
MKLKLLVFLILFLISFEGFSQEGEVSSIQINGAKKTKVGYLKRILDSKVGEPLDSTLLNDDINRLKRLPALSHASYTVTPKENNKYQIIITIEENFTIIPVVNFWTNNRSSIAYKLGVYDYNTFGRNIGFGGFYQNNGFDTYAVNFRAPQLFSKKLGLAVNHQNWKSQEPLYFDDDVANYKYNNISLEILGLYQLNSKNHFELGINIFKEKYDYLSGATNASTPLNLDLNKLLYKFIYTYDNLKYNYQYPDGFKSQFYGQLVKSEEKNNDNFLIAWSDFFYFRRMGTKGNWANRLRMGLSTNNDSPFAPFSLDNNINLRGVGILVDRGTGSIVLNSEYRHTLFEKNWFSVQGNAFIDAGSWRNPGGKLNDFTNDENIRLFSGIGLRIMHKRIYNAILRIDYGHSLRSDGTKGFVFGVGQYF